MDEKIKKSVDKLNVLCYNIIVLFVLIQLANIKDGEKMRKAISITSLIFAITCLFNSCYYIAGDSNPDFSVKDNVEWIDKESHYDKYEVKGKEVNIYCTLTFKNKGDKDAVFYLCADFADDKEIGLVTEGLLYGFNTEDKKDTIYLEANTKKTYEYVFKGKFGGVNRKATRLCPDIEIQEIEEK